MDFTIHWSEGSLLSRRQERVAGKQLLGHEEVEPGAGAVPQTKVGSSQMSHRKQTLQDLQVASELECEWWAMTDWHSNYFSRVKTSGQMQLLHVQQQV